MRRVSTARRSCGSPARRHSVASAARRRKQGSSGDPRCAPLVATCATRGAVDPSDATAVGLKALLSIHRVYALPVVAGRTRGPALIARQVSSPRSAQTSCSPEARLGAPSTVRSRKRAARSPWFPQNAGTRQPPPQARSAVPLSYPGRSLGHIRPGPAPRHLRGSPTTGTGTCSEMNGGLVAARRPRAATADQGPFLRRGAQSGSG
jgi:hypothetical protein